LPAWRQTGQALEVKEYACVPSALHLSAVLAQAGLQHPVNPHMMAVYTKMTAIGGVCFEGG